MTGTKSSGADNRIIRETRLEDIPRILEIFDDARTVMRNDGNLTQWANGYPAEDDIKKDIERGESFVIEDEDKVVGTFAFIPGIEPTYIRIDGGSWIDDTLPYATIHRIAGCAGSHGIAKSCFDWAWKRIPNLRIDTHRDNNIMKHCIEKAGFKFCGIIYLRNGDERNAYQKISVI